MPSKKKLPSAVLIVLGLLLPAAYAQDLPMRQSPTWDGSNTAGGRPRQGYYPGIEQQELLQHQQVLQTWQDAERRSYETRVTPEHVLRDLQAKIQQCHNTGNFEGEANYWNNLAQTLQSGGLGPYAPPGLDAVTCYKGEVTARLERITQAQQQRDPGTELAEWERVRPLASAFASRDPGDARWPFLVAMSYFKAGPGSYNSARQWLNTCMNSPACQPELKGKCQSLLSEMTAEEERIRREEEARAARERQLAAERAKQAEKERAAQDVARVAAEHAPDGVNPDHYRKWIIFEKGSKNSIDLAAYYANDAMNQKNWKEMLFFVNQLIASEPQNKTWYTWRSQAELDLDQLQAALDDCKKAQQLGDHRQVMIDLQKNLESRLRH